MGGSNITTSTIASRASGRGGSTSRGIPGVVDGSALRARVAFLPLPGHEVVGHLDCPHWLPWGVSRLYLLDRTTVPAAAARPSADPGGRAR